MGSFLDLLKMIFKEQLLNLLGICAQNCNLARKLERGFNDAGIRSPCTAFCVRDLAPPLPAGAHGTLQK